MRYAIALAVLLTGCGTTPKEVIDTGTKTVHSLKLPADKAALCMARNAENHAAGLIASARPRNGGQELIVRLPSQEHTIFVAHIEPASLGSRATIWYRGYMAGGEDARAAMLVGC